MENIRDNLYDLPSQISDLRRLMISTGTVYGLSSNETLRYSEELDKLIIQFQLLNK